MNAYFYGEDYDASSHMMNDPVDFQTYGYGGFGYDTSHVPQNEPKSELEYAAGSGNIFAVKRIVETLADETSIEKKNDKGACLVDVTPHLLQLL